MAEHVHVRMHMHMHMHTHMHVCMHTHRQMGLAIGVVEMAHNVGNWLGKVAVNVSEPIGGGDWHATLWFAFGLCVVSALLVAPCFWLLAAR